MKSYVGIDNGISGSIGIINPGYEGSILIPTPVIKQQDYTKTKKMISRLDVSEFRNILSFMNQGIIAVIERPMINPMRFKNSISAARCHEAQLGVLELLGIPYMFIDSKQWQSDLLPHVPLKKKEGESKKEKAKRQRENQKTLKKLSKDIGIRLFPGLIDEIEKQGDADGILIAEWARRKNL